MLTISDKSQCCGCTACYNACPKSAICMVIDNEGFLYPKINMDLCVDCKLCEKVCPVDNTQPVGKPLKAFVLQYKNDTVRMNSTSGAAVNAIAEYILERGGCVYGAELSDDVKCRHIRIDSINDLTGIQGSKYVQSDLDLIFNDVRNQLDNGRYVLFVGMPCQISGLKSLLSKDYENLYTIDLVCHGVPSPGLFEDFVAHISRKYNKKVSNVVFRDKSYGYSASNVKVYFDDGSCKDCNNTVKTFTRMMFSGLSLRPSCYDCAFKTMGRISDFTLFDCAMISAYCPQMDDDKGTTSVFVHSEKGLELLSKPDVMDKIRISDADIDELVKTEGTMMLSSARKNPKRAAFFDDRQSLTYEQLCKKYAPVSAKMVVGNIVKKSLRLTGPIGRKLLALNKKRSIREYQKKYSSK